MASQIGGAAAGPPRAGGGGRIDDRDWGAIRAEYVAGGISQKALAEKHGVTGYALRQRAMAEGWKALRNDRQTDRVAKAREDENKGRGEAEARADEKEDRGEAEARTDEKEDRGEAEAREAAGAGERIDTDAEIALRTRRKLLAALERMADEIPDMAATEYKTQDESAVRLFKLRDFTAAYRELADGLTLGEEARDEVRIIVDP